MTSKQDRISEILYQSENNPLNNLQALFDEKQEIWILLAYSQGPRCLRFQKFEGRSLTTLSYYEFYFAIN